MFPPRCLSCRGSGQLLCPACFGRLRILEAPRCDRCGAPTIWPVECCRECSGRRLGFATARAAVAYEDPVPALLRAWKERGLRRVVDLAAALVDAHVERPAADAITYIPPDPGRQLTRAGHPAERLAHALGDRWGLRVEPLLARRASVRRQTGLPLRERRRNVRDAFVSTARTRDKPPGRPPARATSDPPASRVVLVDDVYTTGATVSAAAQVLRSAGAASVEVVTFARTVR